MIKYKDHILSDLMKRSKYNIDYFKCINCNMIFIKHKNFSEDFTLSATNNSLHFSHIENLTCNEFIIKNIIT